ncbi:MAG: VWA domain-containing protein [Deinococcales bacterium]|nr:VWA domain-containing protein [Deinococcales bacterium]
MSFLAPQALWLLALLPVVVLLHFLRARRRRYDVAALFLWRRASAALARRRRFSPTWLLVAQLAFVALAALALARPVLAGGERPDRVIVIDASASMAAVDAAGTRLEQAKQAARALLGGAGRVALVRAGLDARLLAPLDADEAGLRAALDELSAGDAAGDLLRALELAGSLLPGAEVHVFTDRDAGLGAATLHRVGGPVDNVGISAFDVGVGQAFVAVVASGARPAEVEVSLWQGERELARGTVLVPSGGSGSVTFPLGDVSGVVEARLTPPPGDALALDDVAFAGRRALSVVSNDDHAPLLRALTAVPLTQVGVATDAAFRPGADLKVLRRASPEGLPPGNYLLFPPPAAEPDFRLVRDWDRVDPLTRFVDLRDVVVGLDPSAEAWDEEGWRVLARTADLTPVMRARQDENGLVLQLAFHPSQSDVVLRPAFPALVANLLGGLDATTRLRLGEPLPDGAGAVLEPGVYADGAVFASLLAADESRLPAGPTAGQAPVAPGPGAPVAEAAPAASAPAASVDDAPSPLALALLGLAAAALLLEWILFSGSRGRRLVG